MATTPKTEGKRPSGWGLGRIAHELNHRRHHHRQWAGVALVFVLTALGHPTATEWGIGTAFVVAGLLVRLWASGIVMKNEVLATSGPYAFVRHPLYVGNLLLAAGFCAGSGLGWSWVAMGALLLYFYPHTIRYEDSKLERLFGDPWHSWSSETGALWPRLSPYAGEETQKLRWSLRTSMMRNGEPIHVIVGALCLYWLWLQQV